MSDFYYKDVLIKAKQDYSSHSKIEWILEGVHKFANYTEINERIESYRKENPDAEGIPTELSEPEETTFKVENPDFEEAKKEIQAQIDQFFNENPYMR